MKKRSRGGGCVFLVFGFFDGFLHYFIEYFRRENRPIFFSHRANLYGFFTVFCPNKRPTIFVGGILLIYVAFFVWGFSLTFFQLLKF